MPDSPSAACVVRLRYNMSTYDYDGWNTYAGGNLALTNDPEVDVGIAGTQLQLNINTAQFGRTFEDRTHIFEILSRPASVADTATIYNLNVRGKRGNNAATHPSCEVPFRLTFGGGRGRGVGVCACVWVRPGGWGLLMMIRWRLAVLLDLQPAVQTSVRPHFFLLLFSRCNSTRQCWWKQYDFVPKHLWVRPADYVHFQVCSQQRA